MGESLGVVEMILNRSSCLKTNITLKIRLVHRMKIFVTSFISRCSVTLVVRGYGKKKWFYIYQLLGGIILLEILTKLDIVTTHSKAMTNAQANSNSNDL